MDFVSDMKELIRAVFSHNGIDYFDPEKNEHPTKRLKKWITNNPDMASSDPSHLLLRQFVNTNIKFISQKQRSTFVSKKVSQSTAPEKNRQVAQIIQNKLASGQDVNSYLSKGLIVAYEEDQLLSSWKMFHFHLNETQSNSSFFKDRSGWLLMAYIESDCAYLLDIREHQESDDEGNNLVWTRQEMIEILDREFPDAISNHKLNGVIGIERTLTDKELRQARAAGLNILPSTDSSVFAPFGGGLATNGTSIQVTRHTDQLMNMINLWEDHIKENESQIKSDFSNQGVDATNLDFRLGLDEQGFFVYELNSDIRISNLSQTAYFNPNGNRQKNED